MLEVSVEGYAGLDPGQLLAKEIDIVSQVPFPD